MKKPIWVSPSGLTVIISTSYSHQLLITPKDQCCRSLLAARSLIVRYTLGPSWWQDRLLAYVIAAVLREWVRRCIWFGKNYVRCRYIASCNMQRDCSSDLHLDHLNSCPVYSSIIWRNVLWYHSCPGKTKWINSLKSPWGAFLISSCLECISDIDLDNLKAYLFLFHNLLTDWWNLVRWTTLLAKWWRMSLYKDCVSYIVNWVMLQIMWLQFYYSCR